MDQWNVTGELGLFGPFQSQHFGVLKSLKVVPLMETEFRRDCVGNLGCVMHLGGYVERGPSQRNEGLWPSFGIEGLQRLLPLSDTESAWRHLHP